MSVPAIEYRRGMGRWAPDARGRLARAAIELFLERGYDDTTVADIATRADLTERTFFRHYADKREVLFGGQEALVDAFLTAIAAAPAVASPMELVGEALEASGTFFADRLEFARVRQAVIDANPALQERELIKLASFADAIATALVGRGVGATAAGLAAEIGMAVFRTAFARWLEAPPGQAPGEQDLVRHIREVRGELGTLLVSSPW